MYLLEMVVAIGLSGVFVCLLSAMLSQTLSLSNASQNLLIASTAADLLVENARAVPYSAYQPLIGTKNLLPMNIESVGQTPTGPNQIRTSSGGTNYPAQLDLTGLTSQDPTAVYGTVNGNQGTVNVTNQWQSGKGNFLRNNTCLITEAVSAMNPSPVPGVNTILVTIQVTYPGSFGSTSSTNTRTITRYVPIFANDTSVPPSL